METNDNLQDLANGQSQESAESLSAFSNEDINYILESNGIISDEDEELNRFDENQGEGTDFSLETLLEEESSDSPSQAPSEETVPTGNTEPSPNENEEAAGDETTEEVTIPQNSPTLLLDESTTRFSGAEWFNEIQKANVIIAGQGGIGSNLSFQIARMVPSCITLYDDDVVEAVNMAGQLYSYRDIGKSKVNAIAEMITSYTSLRRINALQEKFTDITEPGNIMMCGFDNMKARSTFFKAWKRHLERIVPVKNLSKCLYMDGRLSMDTLQIFCIRGDDDYNIKRYEREFLFSDEKAEHTVCSMKQTTYLACMIGSLMTNLFTNFIANTLDPIIPYDLPFFTEYDAQNMIFKTES